MLVAQGLFFFVQPLIRIVFCYLSITRFACQRFYIM
jgi:hypothetical protein